MLTSRSISWLGKPLRGRRKILSIFASVCPKYMYHEHKCFKNIRTPKSSPASKAPIWFLRHSGLVHAGRFGLEEFSSSARELDLNRMETMLWPLVKKGPLGCISSMLFHDRIVDVKEDTFFGIRSIHARMGQHMACTWREVIVILPRLRQQTIHTDGQGRSDAGVKIDHTGSFSTELCSQRMRTCNAGVSFTRRNLQRIIGR